MINLSTLVFAALFFWRCVSTAFGQDSTGGGSGLALAQASRSKDNVRRGQKDGVVRLSVSPVTKPEHLAFEAPPHSHSSADSIDGGDTFHELQLQDILLLASVDGKFHALSRTTGQTIWSMEDHDSEKSGDPHDEMLHHLVRTDHNLEATLQADGGVGEIYIVEPQSGEIFVLSTDPEG
jgi:serine/threonine-protein kinase/endoribonuclease IRE1